MCVLPDCYTHMECDVDKDSSAKLGSDFLLSPQPSMTMQHYDLSISGRHLQNMKLQSGVVWSHFCFFFFFFRNTFICTYIREQSSWENVQEIVNGVTSESCAGGLRCIIKGRGLWGTKIFIVCIYPLFTVWLFLLYGYVGFYN